MPKLGAAAIALYLPHAAWHLADGSGWDLLWACNAAMVALAAGCFTGARRVCASAFLVLAYGTPMWGLDIVTGSTMVPTSPLVHVGGLVIAVLAVRGLGWPPRSWLAASLASALLVVVSRLVTPPAMNVNLAFRVHDGWERWFPSHVVAVVVLWSLASAVFWILE